MVRQLPLSPKSNSKAVAKAMRGNKASNTKPELILRKALRDAKLSGYRLHWKKVPGRPDIAYPGKKLAIFVNGCFWHRCPICSNKLPKTNSDFWKKKFELNESRDLRKKSELESIGWKVVVVWECKIKAMQLDDVINAVSDIK